MSSSINRIGVSLSGGGYRATAFHLGTFKKLNDLGVLEKVEVISTISGGSITGACYCSREEDVDFERFYKGLYEGLQAKGVIGKVFFSWLGLRFLFFILILAGSFYFLFTDYAWVFPIIWIIVFLLLLKFQFQIFPVSTRIEEVYDKFFFHNRVLGQLKESPMLVIGATNLQTAKPFTFTKFVMRDTTYQYLDNPVRFKSETFPLARAVMASSCVPFAFTPVTISKEYFEDADEFEKYHPVLVDGGVYDNQGIHNVMQSGRYECNTVITSDAGSGATGEMAFKNVFSLLMETVSVFMSRIKKAQMVRNVYDNAATRNKEIAYFSLGWDVENCIPGFIKNLEKKQITKAVIEQHELLPEWVEKPKEYQQQITTHLKDRTCFDKVVKPSDKEKKIARSIGTNLTRLSKKKVDCLVKQAEALTEVQVRLYCPSIIK